jgi:O-antigen/teichoic acid export membrane protein
VSDATSAAPNPRLISSTISLSVYSVISLGLGLVTTLIITHNFSTEVFGLYILILVVVNFLERVSTFGIGTSVPRFIVGAADEASKEQYLSASIILRFVSVALASLLAWFGRPVLTMIFGQSLLPSYMLYIPLLYVLDSFRTFFSSVLQGCLLFSKMGMSDVILSLSNVILLLWFISGTDRSLSTLFLLKAVSTIISGVYGYIVIPIKKRLTFQGKVYKDLISFGAPLQINDMLGFVFERIDTVVVGAFLGPTGIAIYEVARKIPDSLRNFYRPFRSVFYPILAKQSANDDKLGITEFLSHGVRILAFVTLLGSAIALLFGQEIILLLFPVTYLSSVPIFAVLMVNMSYSLIGDLMGTTIVALGDSNKPMIINSFNSAASWLGAVLLVPIYSTLGAAIGTTIGTILAIPLNVFFLGRLAKMKKSAYLKPSLLFFVWSAIVLLTQPTSLWMKVVFLIAFLLASGLLSLFTRQDIAFLYAESRFAAQLPLQKIRVWAARLLGS